MAVRAYPETAGARGDGGEPAPSAGVEGRDGHVLRSRPLSRPRGGTTKDRGELRALEDEAIRSAVQRQIDCGLDVVTDGEFRRWMFMNSFYDAVDGVRTGKSVTFRNDRGEDVRLNIHEIVGRLAPIDSPGAREAAFMADASGGYPFKVTFPAPSIFGHPLTTVVGRDEGGYGSLEEFVAHAYLPRPRRGRPAAFLSPAPVRCAGGCWRTSCASSLRGCRAWRRTSV